jgi:acetyltransferase-like isoleucine patch superfamily enzyme
MASIKLKVRLLSYLSRLSLFGIGTYIFRFFHNYFSFVEISSKFNHSIDIDGDGSIYIGQNCSFGKYSFLCFTGKGNIKIGSNFSCNRNCHINASLGEINIGDDVMIGPNVVLRSSNHVFNSVGVFNCSGHIRGSINILNNVWIASNVVVCPNVTICSNVVIGAGSVVTKDIMLPGIYAGVPARRIGDLNEI